MLVKSELRVAIIGPLPPPAGGMAGQTRQLQERLAEEGIAARIVPTNPPYRPAFVTHLRGLRALIRLLPYVRRLWQAAGRSDVFHVMANSGWAWHLFAAPAIWVAKLRGTRVVVNYRGGAADAFLSRSIRSARATLRMADVLAVPSEFLRGVFARFGIASTIIPNVVDVVLFAPSPAGVEKPCAVSPHVVIARNLERIYDIPTAVRAFAILRAARPAARLSIAGSGTEGAALARLIDLLGLAGAVAFRGALSREAMADLYRSATLVLNSSVVDNTPNSLLEAMACGVPIVSSNVGGIPYLVQDGTTALLVPSRDPAAMAKAMNTLLDDPALADRLVANGLQLAQRCAWHNIYPMWLRAYQPNTDASPVRLARESDGTRG